ncbi:RhuM family protein [Bacillus sp. FJAT-22090]|uniref:RhuM family protein n=1 Tax=Bacillus sp. FJAT-22090 TaxID=1581038 RepID=UPI0011A7C833|nr:RhuM family protein [Bacillus sp. FJAT-22090]
MSAEFSHTTLHGAIEGKTQTKEVKFYNLDAIISVGYRVNSQKATKFRIWATDVLKSIFKNILKIGFKIDIERMKQDEFERTEESTAKTNVYLTGGLSYGFRKQVWDYRFIGACSC